MGLFTDYDPALAEEGESSAFPVDFGSRESIERAEDRRRFTNANIIGQNKHRRYMTSAIRELGRSKDPMNRLRAAQLAEEHAEDMGITTRAFKVARANADIERERLAYNDQVLKETGSKDKTLDRFGLTIGEGRAIRGRQIGEGYKDVENEAAFNNLVRDFRNNPSQPVVNDTPRNTGAASANDPDAWTGYFNNPGGGNIFDYSSRGPEGRMTPGDYGRSETAWKAFGTLASADPERFGYLRTQLMSARSGSPERGLQVMHWADQIPRIIRIYDRAVKTGLIKAIDFGKKELSMDNMMVMHQHLLASGLLDQDAGFDSKERVPSSLVAPRLPDEEYKYRRIAF